MCDVGCRYGRGYCRTYNQTDWRTACHHLLFLYDTIVFRCLASEVVAMGRVAECRILAIFRIRIHCNCNEGRNRLASGNLCSLSACVQLRSRNCWAKIVATNTETGTTMTDEQCPLKC